MKLFISLFAISILYTFPSLSVSADAAKGKDQPQQIKRDEMTAIVFIPDTKQADIGAEDAEALVDFAMRKFEIELDYSDASIEQVEIIAAAFYQSLKESGFPEEPLKNASYMLGGYIGEVIRRNHGAEWGISVHGEEKYNAMRRWGTNLFWPNGKTEKRLRNGDEDNLWHYYQYLLSNEPEA